MSERVDHSAEATRILLAHPIGRMLDAQFGYSSSGKPSVDIDRRTRASALDGRARTNSEVALVARRSKPGVG